MSKSFDFDKIQKTENLIVQYGLEDAKLMLAVSAGVDSIVMAHHLNGVVRKFPELKLGIAFVHHGILPSGGKLNEHDVPVNDAMNAYRNAAQKFTANFAADLKLPFFTNEPEHITETSEEFLRNTRHTILEGIRARENFDLLVKAQHRDDLLETRMIRLVRGTGPEGMQAMLEKDDENFRPLLTWSKADILEYGDKYDLEFVVDPSNADEAYFRNWMRNNWLQSLEDYRAGSRSSLTKSLENISEATSDDRIILDTIEEDKIVKSKLLVLKIADQRRVLAYYLNQLAVKNYTSQHLDEIIKRLDSPRKELTFTVANCVWEVDTKHIFASQRDMNNG